jgi:O-antigen/teichoic acid export membrane protein
MISTRFIRSSLLYTLGGAMPMASGLLLLPFYTDLLALETYGILMLYVAFSLFIQLFTTYALDAYLGIHYLELQHDANTSKRLVAEVSGLLLMIGTGVLIFSYIAGKPLFDLSFNRGGNLSFFPWGILSVLVGVLNGIFKVTTNLLVYRQEAWKYFLYNFFNLVLTVTISLIGLYEFPGELTGPIWGRVLSGIGISALALIYLSRNYGIRFSTSALKDLNKFCAPYVVYMLMIWVLANIDRYIINATLDAEKVGLFDFALRCAMVIELLQNGLMAAVNPPVFTIWKNDNKHSTTAESNRYFNGFTAVCVMLVAFFALAIPAAVPVFVKNEAFYPSLILINLLLSGFVLRGIYHFYLSPLLYLKNTRLLPLVFACSAAVQIPLTWYLAKYYDIEGAVFANIAVKAVQVLFLWLFVRSRFNFKFNALKLVVLPVLFIGAQVTIWFMSKTFNWQAQAILLLVSITAIGLTYYHELKLTFSRFLRPSPKP